MTDRCRRRAPRVPRGASLPRPRPGCSCRDERRDESPAACSRQRDRLTPTCGGGGTPASLEGRAYCLRRDSGCVHDADVCARAPPSVVPAGVRIRLPVVERLRLFGWHLAVRCGRGRLGCDRASTFPSCARAVSRWIVPSASCACAPALKTNGARRERVVPARFDGRRARAVSRRCATSRLWAALPSPLCVARSSGRSGGSRCLGCGR